MLRPSQLTAKSTDRIAGAALPWREWVAHFLPDLCPHPFGERHVRLWEWFEALAPGIRPRARVECWPRGGAKSSSVELGVSRAGARLSRRFCLYVSATQDQADKHVQAIGSLFVRLGVERAISRYGTAKGWRRDELHTANGFTVAAYGLDTAARGIKVDQYRPDLICFDDIDSQDDSPKTTDKKADAITTAILPAGSADCAVLYVQNLIHEESIASRLVDGRADFLRDREPPVVEPAVRGLETELVPRGDGTNLYRITAGEATWEGQSLAVCERQINDWGLRAFLREAQHEVAGASGYYFDVTKLGVVEDVPLGLRRGRGWDLAATEGGGDFTAGVLIGVDGRHPDTRVFILDVQHGQWATDRVRMKIGEQRKTDGAGIALRLPQDPGQAGVAQAAQFRMEFPGAIIRPCTGSKASRASGFAEVLNRGQVSMVRADWNHGFREELRKFKEDESHASDDLVDAVSDIYNELAPKRELWAV